MRVYYDWVWGIYTRRVELAVGDSSVTHPYTKEGFKYSIHIYIDCDVLLLNVVTKRETGTASSMLHRWFKHSVCKYLLPDGIDKTKR